MAVSEDATALVAAQLTVAWVHRMGVAVGREQGSTGPTILGVYQQFRKDLRAADAATGQAETDAWIDSLKDR